MSVLWLSQTKSSTSRFFLLWRFPDFKIYLDFDMPNWDKRHSAGATGQQRMLTFLRHLISPLSFWRFALLCFEFVFWDGSSTVCNCHFFISFRMLRGYKLVSSIFKQFVLKSFVLFWPMYNIKYFIIWEQFTDNLLESIPKKNMDRDK